MQRCMIGDEVMLVPTLQEWNHLLAGGITHLDDIAVLSADNLRAGFMRDAIERGGYETDQVYSFLVKQRVMSKRLWWPRMLLWPSGRPSLEQLCTSDHDPGCYLRVYFHRFHCFDCGADADGYAIDWESYRPSDHLRAAELVKPLLKRCRNCAGDLRNPRVIAWLQGAWPNEFETETD